MKIILGSQSKGRKKMMEEMGLEFEVMTADIDEKSIRFEDPKMLVAALAHAKADELIKRIKEPAVLITSDQVVVWKDQIREKPENEKEAREFLLGYNSAPAETVTAVVVTNTETGARKEGVDVAKIHFHPYSETEIKELIDDGKIYNFAGGFTVDDKMWKGASHIKLLEGERDSSIGLPKKITLDLIKEVLE